MRAPRVWFNLSLTVWPEWECYSCAFCQRNPFLNYYTNIVIPEWSVCRKRDLEGVTPPTRRVEMVSWWPCIVAKARALSRYIPRASGAALCFSNSSTTFTCPKHTSRCFQMIANVSNCFQMLIKSLITLVWPALEAQTRAELPWLSLASTLASKASHLDIWFAWCCTFHPWRVETRLW